MLTDKERNTIVKALRQWATNAPNQPMLGFLQGGALMTPREILAAVQEGTEDGVSLLEIFEYVVRREGIDAVTSRLRRSQPGDDHISDRVES